MILAGGTLEEVPHVLVVAQVATPLLVEEAEGNREYCDDRRDGVRNSVSCDLQQAWQERTFL